MTFLDITLKISLFGRAISIGCGAWPDDDDDEAVPAVKDGFGFRGLG